MRRIELQSALISRTGLPELILLHENDAELVLHLGNLTDVGKRQSEARSARGRLRWSLVCGGEWMDVS